MIRALLLVSALAASTAAQTVCVRGRVERASGISICAVRFTHRLQCPNLLLNSATVNLQSYEGQIVELCGTLSSLPPCRRLDVTSVNTTVDHLNLVGPVAYALPRGGIAQFDLGITPARLWLLFYSDGRGFTDLGATGVLQLGTRILYFADGFLDGAGQSSFQAQVPNDPALASVWLYFQPVFVDLATLQAALGNADCFQIQ